MWPFKRKQLDVRDLPPLSDDSHVWGVIQVEYDSAPLIIRINKSAKPWAGHPGLPVKLAFAIPLNAPNPAGLPDPGENEELDEVEDLIRATIEAHTPALHAVVLTTGTVKELVFYIPSGVDIAAIHQAAQAANTSHEVQCIGKPDPTWETYRQFLQG